MFFLRVKKIYLINFQDKKGIRKKYMKGGKNDDAMIGLRHKKGYPRLLNT
jgi:hypothetical protein